MKKLVLLLFIIAFSTSYTQNTNLRTTAVKSKYENVFYRCPSKFNNQEQEFKVSKIEYTTSYKGSKSKNRYQIVVHGSVNNNEEQIIYNAKSVDELEYYKNLFKNGFSRMILYEYDYKVSTKSYQDATITVEY